MQHEAIKATMEEVLLNAQANVHSMRYIILKQPLSSSF